MSTGARARARALISHYVALGVADEALEAEEQEYPTGVILWGFQGEKYHACTSPKCM
jgi:hypothetical protein